MKKVPITSPPFPSPSQIDLNPFHFLQPPSLLPASGKRPQFFRKKNKAESPTKKQAMGSKKSHGGGKSVPPVAAEDLALEEYDSDAASRKKRKKRVADSSDSSGSDSDQEEEDHVLKIYYVSRTHTQLTQFIKEARATSYGKDLRAVTLGSRSMLCVNEEVLSLKSRSGQNDKCREMREEKNKKKRCPYLVDKESNADLVEFVKTELRDLEDIITVGKKKKACPYFSSRKLIPGVELVALPYQAMLHAGTRETLGVKLEGNAVIFDEAHNVIDAVSSVHSVTVPLVTLRAVHGQLSRYKERYQTRLSTKNLRYVDQVLKVVDGIAKAVRALHTKHYGPRENTNLNGGVGKGGAKVASSSVVEEDAKVTVHALNDFLFELRLDHFNLFKVEEWIAESGITKKLHGFVTHHIDAEGGGGVAIHTEIENDSSMHTNGNAIMQVRELLQALNNADQDGRILLSAGNDPKQCSVGYIMLNAATHFESIVKEARSVILAGGTMGPHQELMCQLFPSIESDSLHSFSCGHVVPAENLLTLCVPSGPSGKKFDFRFTARSDTSQLDELGRLVQNVCRMVPNGVVLFFASYAFEEQVHSQWKKTGQLDRLLGLKSLFREPKESNQVDSLLEDYSAAARSSKGALLTCAIGGKLSEGINFADELGRCVIVVGLPYPNKFSPVLMEKMTYFDEMRKKNPMSISGNEYYDSLCMKAVNQAIGRCIRHMNDHATIMLIDQRYTNDQVIRN